MKINVLDISTSHLPREVAEWLQGEAHKNSKPSLSSEYGKVAGTIHAANTYYGWFVYCHDDGTDDYPERLVKIFDWARQVHGCDYILFDEAGEKYEGLEVFEW